MTTYQGPLRDEPLAMELHNTLFAVRGELIDGLESPEALGAWLAAIADRLPRAARDADASRLPEFLALRGAVRETLQAALAGKGFPAASLELLNRAAAGAPASRIASEGSAGRLRAETRYHTADPTEIALAALAADAIELAAEPSAGSLRACGAPGCVLMYVRAHPRQRWCSTACGNRVRQARHYRRTHARD
jgi:predicted RNA-binding Zn ribbon-like protein